MDGRLSPNKGSFFLCYIFRTQVTVKHAILILEKSPGGKISKTFLIRTINTLFYGTNYMKGENKMDEEIKRLLDEEIKSEIADLYNLAPGSEEQSAAIDNLVKLYKLRIEETRNELDYNEKKEQLAAQGIDRYFRLGVETAGVILPLIFYAVWMKRGFKFEETGTYTSTTFRGLFNRFRPTK